MSPILAAFIGGILGGLLTGVILALTLMLFGKRVAESLLRQQVVYLETRFREQILDLMLARIAAFLDQGERISQIVKRVVEIVQLLFRNGTVEPRPAAETTGLGQQLLHDLAAAVPRPPPATT